MQSRGEIDPFAQQIIAIDDDVAEMHADSETQAAMRFGAKFALHFDRALHRFDDGRKLRDQAIARRIGDAAMVARDELLEHCPRRAQRLQRPHLVSFHATAIAGGVSGEDGGKLALDLGHWRRSHFLFGARTAERATPVAYGE